MARPLDSLTRPAAPAAGPAVPDPIEVFADALVESQRERTIHDLALTAPGARIR